MIKPFPVCIKYCSFFATALCKLAGEKLCWLTLLFLILASLDWRHLEIGHLSFFVVDSSSAGRCGTRVPWLPNVEKDDVLDLLEVRPPSKELSDFTDSFLSMELVELSEDFLFTDGRDLRNLSNIENFSGSILSSSSCSCKSSSWLKFVSDVSSVTIIFQWVSHSPHCYLDEISCPRPTDTAP